MLSCLNVISSMVSSEATRQSEISYHVTVSQTGRSLENKLEWSLWRSTGGRKEGKIKSRRDGTGDTGQGCPPSSSWHAFRLGGHLHSRALLPVWTPQQTRKNLWATTITTDEMLQSCMSLCNCACGQQKAGSLLPGLLTAWMAWWSSFNITDSIRARMKWSHPTSLSGITVLISYANPAGIPVFSSVWSQH